MEYGYGVSDAGSNRDTGFLVNPLSFLRLGYYHWSDGNIGNRGGYGLYWSSTSSSGTSAYLLNFGSSSLYYRFDRDRGRGYTVRCVVCFDLFRLLVTNLSKV